jgi:hypothetical protein
MSSGKNGINSEFARDWPLVWRPAKSQAGRIFLRPLRLFRLQALVTIPSKSAQKEDSVMSRSRLEDRVKALERQLGLLLADRTTGRAKDWRRTRGAFTGDELMKQIFAEGRKFRAAERKPSKPRRRKRHAHS